MISLDGSIIPAIIIFLTLVITLNYTLFRPLVRVQEERESRTTGTVAQANKNLQHYADLFDRYQAAIKNARIETYRLQEQARGEALNQRAGVIDQAKQKADALLSESRESIRNQVEAARKKLGQDAEDMARTIAAAILRKTA